MIRVITQYHNEVTWLDYDHLDEAVEMYEHLRWFYGQCNLFILVHLVYADNGKDVAA